MKKITLTVLAMILSLGAADLSAQNFLKKLGESVKNEVNKEVGKHVKKAAENHIKKVVNKKAESTEEQSDSDGFYAQLEKRAPIVNIPPMVEYGPDSGHLNGHEWIDLGLPSGTRWSTCNVDATMPHQPGKHYSWGETSTKSSYEAGNTQTYGKEMADIAGDKACDVATAKWGDGWKMPTEEQMRELLKYCSDQYVQKEGRRGREFTSFENKKSIFLPAAGSKEGTSLKEANGCGLYWTSTPYSDNAAHMYTFGAGLGEMSIGGRDYGFAVRPVTDYDVDTEIPFDGETQGHKWVDLGLPSGIKWATCNVGADAVDQDGNYYRWGDISGYFIKGSTYADENVQKDISGDAAYDAATAHWGENWQMPSALDFVELIENCTWERTNIGRRKGLKVTSKINGKYIFLPYSGESDYTGAADRLPNEVNESLSYWTSTPMRGWQNKYDAYYFNALYDEVCIRSGSRHSYGWCIRPVIK